MRPILPGDLDLGVRVLLAAPPAHWRALALCLVVGARLGAAHRRAHGRGHPRYGSGSIAAAAAAHKRAPLPDTCDRGYLSALQVLVGTILEAGIPGREV